MNTDKIDTLLGYLAEIGAFISEVKFRAREHDKSIKISEAVENYLNGFNFSSPNGDDVAPMRNVNDALQLNSKGKIAANSISHKGEEELVKLKHGQGSIHIRIRYNKNGTIYKLYQGRYYDEYGKLKSVYGRTQKECLKKLREAHPVKKNAPCKQIYPTLKDWMLAWYNDYKKNSLRLSTQRGYEALMQTYIFPALGKIKLPAVTTEFLQHFFIKLKNGNTRKKIFLLLSACLKKAVVLKKLQFNPCDAVELPKYKKKKRRPFEYEEQNLILSEGSRTAQAFFFMCATGLRIGEFLALTKDDFYFEQNVFKVDKALVQGVVGDPKSEAGCRNVFFMEELFENFDINLLGTFTYSGLKNSLDKIMAENGIVGVSWHCTRHTYATICHSFRMDDKVLQDQLGHSTLAMTQDVYTHLLKKGTSKIGAYLSNLCTHICTHI